MCLLFLMLTVIGNVELDLRDDVGFLALVVATIVLDLEVCELAVVGEFASIEGFAEDKKECVELLAKTGKVDWKKENFFSKTPLYLGLETGKTH